MRGPSLLQPSLFVSVCQTDPSGRFPFFAAAKRAAEELEAEKIRNGTKTPAGE